MIQKSELFLHFIIRGIIYHTLYKISWQRLHHKKLRLVHSKKCRVELGDHQIATFLLSFIFVTFLGQNGLHSKRSMPFFCTWIKVTNRSFPPRLYFVILLVFYFTVSYFLNSLTHGIGLVCPSKV